MKISHSLDSLGAKLIHHLVGIFFLPALPLYLLAYRIMGKPCFYRWGEAEVRPTVGRLTKNEYLFYRTFPALVVLAGFAVLALISWWMGKPVTFF